MPTGFDSPISVLKGDAALRPAASSTENSSRSNGTGWILSGKMGTDDPVRQVPISSFPFRVGRRQDLGLCLRCLTVSKVHAELTETATGLLLRDLGSTNGTFVNGEQIHGTRQLREGDFVQFGNVAVRLNRQDGHETNQTMALERCDRSLALIRFDELLGKRAFTPHYQPIVDLATGQVLAYEVLARSLFPGLSNPAAMFQAAAELSAEGELSRILRQTGVAYTYNKLQRFNLFLNTHPCELQDREIFASLEQLRAAHPEQPITLEIHENSVVDPKMLVELRTALTQLNMGLAFDDFGTGESRVLELADVRPEYLKFDRRLVSGIERAGTGRQQMIASLVQMAKNLGAIPLAEGVETQPESDTCRQLGFVLGQGFVYGIPAPLDVVTRTS